MSLSSLIATLGWFPTLSGAPEGPKVGVLYRREEEAKPLIVVKSVKFGDSIDEVNISVISIKSF